MHVPEDKFDTFHHWGTRLVFKKGELSTSTHQDLLSLGVLLHTTTVKIDVIMSSVALQEDLKSEKK